MLNDINTVHSYLCMINNTRGQKMLLSWMPFQWRKCNTVPYTAPHTAGDYNNLNVHIFNKRKHGVVIFYNEFSFTTYMD